MHARARILAVALLIPTSLSLLPAQRLPSAFAQEDPAVTAEARKRFLEGVDLFDKKKYELARAAFLQAYALKKHPDVLLNLAQSELLSNHAIEAVQHFKDFLRDPATAQHPKRGDAEKGLAEARSKIARIQVTVDQASAEVLLDGKKVGSSPLAEPLDVAPGQHTVEAKKDGKLATQTFLAPEGKITIINLTFGGAPPPPVVTAQPSSDPPRPPPTATAPPPPPPPTSTSTTIEPLSGSGREPFMRWATRHPAAYVGAGLTAVGLGLGLGFLVGYNSAQSSADSLADKIKKQAANDQTLKLLGRTENPCAKPVATGDVKYEKACGNLRESLDAADTNKTVMTTGFILAGAGVATLAIGYFVTAKKTGAAAAYQPPRILIAPILGPDQRGLGVAGAFLEHRSERSERDGCSRSLALRGVTPGRGQTN